MPRGREEAEADAPTAAPDLVGLDSTVVPPHRVAPVSGDAPTVVPAVPFAATLAGSRGPETTLPGDANDLPELPVVDGQLYHLGVEIGRGGMGRVLAARDRRLHRDVVIKVLHRGAATSRFEREALITARLQHPSIVRVYDAGWLGGEQPFYAMERVRGQSLDRVVATAADARARLALLPHVIAIADALAYAHNEGVIHRDLKPHNVLVGTFGETVVIDWGLAKDLRAADGDPSLDPSLDPEVPLAQPHDQTVAGAVMGTPAFMPPEQARGEPADQRSDVYAIGAILYTVLSGAPPISGARVLEDASAGAIVPLREREPSTPPELVTIVEHAMAFERGARYATAKELADELRRYAAGQLVRRHEYSAGALLRRWLRRHRTPIAVAASALVVLAVMLVLGVRGIMHERTRAEANARLAERNLRLVQENSDQLVLGQARRVVDGDPSLALAWLARLSLDGLGRADVHELADLAAARGVGFELGGPKDDIEHVVLGKPGVMFSGSDDGHVWRWHLESRRGDDLAGHVGSIESLAISHDKRLLASGGTDHTVRLWDLVTGESKVLTGHHGGVRGVAFAPDALSVASAGEDGTLRVWSSVTGEGQVLLEDAHPLWPIAWAADGKQLWVGTGDGRLVTLDATPRSPTSGKPGRPAGSTKLHEVTLRVLALSPDGTQLASGGEDGRVVVWTIATGQVRHVTRHDDVVRDVAWSPDGTRIISGGDRVVRVTPLEGKSLELRGNDSGVKDLAISPDGTLVAAAGIDRVVRIWPIAGGAPRAFHGHRASVKAVEFTPDGATLISSSDDDHVRLWPLATPAPAPRGRALEAWIHQRTNMTVAAP